jgi:oligoribonuclease
MNKRSPNYLIWLDCEMTGLDPEKNVLLEIATIVTDNNLRVIAKGPCLTITQDKSALAKMDSWCWKTHTGSGLLDRMSKEGVNVKLAEKKTLAFLRRHCFAKTSPLCGNTIGQDRRFLVKYMPKLHDFFHYQSIDVSTVKQLARRWYTKKGEPPKKKECHRALEDIMESIAELAYYRKKIFKT